MSVLEPSWPADLDLKAFPPLSPDESRGQRLKRMHACSQAWSAVESDIKVHISGANILRIFMIQEKHKVSKSISTVQY